MKITDLLSRLLRMKNVPAKTILVLGTLAGCHDSPPPKSGVDITVPGVEVNVDKNGVEVKAPGVDVKVD